MENSIYGKTDQDIYFTHAFLSSDVKRDFIMMKNLPILIEFLY